MGFEKLVDPKYHFLLKIKLCQSVFFNREKHPQWQGCQIPFFQLGSSIQCTYRITSMFQLFFLNHIRDAVFAFFPFPIFCGPSVRCMVSSFLYPLLCSFMFFYGSSLLVRPFLNHIRHIRDAEFAFLPVSHFLRSVCQMNDVLIFVPPSMLFYVLLWFNPFVISVF